MNFSQFGMVSGSRRLFLLIIVLMLGVSSHQVAAQDDSPEALFRRGAIMYKQERYISARLDFRQIINGYPQSEWAPPASMMLAKSFFSLSDYAEAEAAARALINTYPRSQYAEWAHYMIAACQFRNGQIQEAMGELAGLTGRTSDESLKAHALSALRFSILPVSNPEAVYTALESAGVPRSALNLAAATGEEGELPVTSPVQESIDIPWLERDTLPIGLLAPLTGGNADLGFQLLRGVESVLDQQSFVNGRRLVLLVEDTASDPVTAITRTQSLINAGVIAIIGPVLSESNFGPAAIAQEHGIPFLAPTTTNPNFTRIGNFVYQLNFNPDVQARALADLAQEIGFRTYAIIASNDPWGETVAARFSELMDAYSGSSIYTGFYNTNEPMSNDAIMMEIRERAPESQTLIEQVVVLNPGSLFPDTLMVKEEQNPRGELMLGPINSIDCILISATSDYVIQIASQIVEYHINTVLLGDSGWWSNEPLLRNGSQYINGSLVVAPAGTLSGGDGESFFSGSVGADQAFRIPLMRGADAACILIDCFSRGAADPVTLTNMLNRIEDFQGVSSRITIDAGQRTNRAVDFIRITNGTYTRIDLSQPEQLRREVRYRYFE